MDAPKRITAQNTSSKTSVVNLDQIGDIKKEPEDFESKSSEQLDNYDIKTEETTIYIKSEPRIHINDCEETTVNHEKTEGNC